MYIFIETDIACFIDYVSITLGKRTKAPPPPQKKKKKKKILKSFAFFCWIIFLNLGFYGLV